VGEIIVHLAVVADDDDRRACAFEGFGELVDQGDGQVVGGLVQQQSVRASCEGECEIEPALLTHRKLSDGACKIGVREQPERAEGHEATVHAVRPELAESGVVGGADGAPVA
jgi:hypothetical protein